MRAIVIATGDREALKGVKLRQPVPLLACVDRPVLQHIVEILVEQGITEFDFVLHESSEEIEAFLGNGKRWGSSFTFHLARDPKHPYRILKLLNYKKTLLLVHADCLPKLGGGSLAAARNGPSLLFCRASKSTVADLASWTGWAQLQPDVVASLPVDPDQAELEAHLFVKLQAHGIELVPEALELGTLNGILQAQRSFLTVPYAGMQISGRQVEPAVWISRNVVIHPTAALVAPLFIGENSRIGAGARIGPNAVIGSGTVIDRHTTVQDAMVLPGSYCGEGLELDHVFIDRNRLINLELSAALNISDSFILGTMKGASRGGWASSLLSRALATVLFLATLPLLGVMALLLGLARGGSPLSRRDVVELPANPEPDSWRSVPLRSFRRVGNKLERQGWSCLWLDILPNLLQIVRGKLRFVGVQPRSRQEIERLPEDWRALYLRSRAGLITEAGTLHGSAATVDEIYSSEVYYSAMASVRYDFRLALRFLAQVVHVA